MKQGTLTQALRMERDFARLLEASSVTESLGVEFTANRRAEIRRRKHDVEESVK